MRKLLLLSFIFCLIGCAVKSSVVRLTDNVRPAVPFEFVKIYETEDSVLNKFERVAVVTARGSAVYNTKAALLKALRIRAGQVGANAIILDVSKDKSLAYKAASVYLTAGIVGGREYSAVAIYVYPEEK